MSELVLKPVQTLQEALDIAEIRNTGRYQLTGNQAEITPGQQAEWFYSKYEPAHEADAMHAFIGYTDTPTAYGLARKIGGFFWLTGVIAEDKRGQGHGEILFRHLDTFVREELGTDAYLDVNFDNYRAQNLYRKLGFVVVGKPSEVIIMRHKK